MNVLTLDTELGPRYRRDRLHLGLHHLHNKRDLPMALELHLIKKDKKHD